VRSLVPDGFNWPLGLSMGSDGVLFVADGPYVYTIAADGTRAVAGMLFTPGSPGYTRGVVASAPGEVVVTTAMGMVARWWPAKQAHEVLAQGFDQLYGVALAPKGAVVFVEYGTGRVLSVAGGQVEELARDLKAPKGVAVTGDGTVLVSETGAGRVVKLSGGRAETVLDGLGTPEGLLVRGSTLYIVDTGLKAVIAVDLNSGTRTTIASALPVGAPAGVVPKVLKSIGVLSGPMGPFAGITAGGDGTLYISADAEGSVMALRHV